ncbi:MAG: UDP-N-acetylmuramate dehydrogenase [Longicatena sp.]
MNSLEMVYQYLIEKNIKVKRNILLASLTTLHIGGPAKLLVEVSKVKDIKDTITVCQKYAVPFYVLGRGSNVLALDEGFHGVILHIANLFSSITKIDDTLVKAKSGALLKDVSNFCMEEHLGNFEFACGIPGSVGGAIIMNAGAYDGEMKDIVKEVTFLNEKLEVVTFTNEELDFSYRHSYFSSHFGIVLEVIYDLVPRNKDLIKEKVKDLMNRRYAMQPMDKYSAGSTFQRPLGNHASKLIFEAGLAGKRIGDACVSNKHTGFLINEKDASSQDFQTLITYVQDKVKQQSGYELECEIKFIMNEEPLKII